MNKRCKARGTRNVVSEATIRTALVISHVNLIGTEKPARQAVTKIASAALLPPTSKAASGYA
jgi:hypothetical protein